MARAGSWARSRKPATDTSPPPVIQTPHASAVAPTAMTSALHRATGCRVMP